MANTFVKIATVSVGAGGTATITFSSISSTYTDLCLKLSTRDNNAVPTDSYLNINFNSDTGANYSSRVLTGTGSTTASSGFLAQNNGYIYQGDSAGATASTFSNIEVYIPNYTGNKAKSFSNDGVAESNVTTSTGSRFLALSAGLWSGTSAITRIDITPGFGGLFVQYTTAILYGIKNS
jgi:hypothetical protein